ncbi:hypothetical protein QAO71_17080 (plasmid) [Halopseudomonas sp. SMJS2]|uniref:hypothetical protein n=1 Tax=Halopseudomonas sp. SMJS2 TaxID=3041098 RepID=UPI002452A083|nr:hypothetical protein [Halopseudomonas sp. SMJS2]WGK63483.1 hypothetical protein QAO71_17080 [Halopseudomonas sp. SMJS2]
MIFITEWVGTVLGISGALLIASNVKLSAWGWWLFLISSLSWCLYATLQSAWGLLTLNSFFVLSNALGILRWWLPAMQNLKSTTSEQAV